MGLGEMRRGERLAAVRTFGLRFDVNCSILLTELPLLKRPDAARAAGFDAVEFWWPFDDPAPPDREVDGAPGTGELDYEGLFGQLAAQGYPGWIGCEFKPNDPADSSTSFGWR
jgi:hydroxypyruvate isomerase